MQIHATQAIVEFVISHVLLDSEETLVCFGIPAIGGDFVGIGTDSVFPHCPQLVLCVCIWLATVISCHAIQIKSTRIILTYSLSTIELTGKSVCGKGIVRSHCLLKPSGGCSVVLIDTVAVSIEFADAILPVVCILRTLFHFLKRSK